MWPRNGGSSVAEGSSVAGLKGLSSDSGAHGSNSGNVGALVSQLTAWRANANQWISSQQTLSEPLILSVTSAGFGIALYLLWQQYLEFRRQVRAHGSLQKAIVAKVFDCLDVLPFVRKLKKQKIDEPKQISRSIRADFKKDNRQSNTLGTVNNDLEEGFIAMISSLSLPQEARAVSNILNELKTRKSMDDIDYNGKVSGTVYMGGPNVEEHEKLVSGAYSLFAHSNPLHYNIFRTVRKIECEVVSMVGRLLGGTDSNGVCGCMTSGGTESILMAVKATRDFMCTRRQIKHPEIVICESAHAAFDKAAEYFGIVLVRTPAERESFKADVKAMSRAITKNTIMIVASAVGYPHGVLDPVEDLAKLARNRGLCLHVDCCLGGFILPFNKQGVQPFDFRVAGVSSISIDTHKYGLAPKGSSVVLYRNAELRKHQFVAVTEWSGGLYVSPTVAGSRSERWCSASGGLIAAAWAAMQHMGWEGYQTQAVALLKCASEIVQKISSIQGLRVLGTPVSTVVAFAAEDDEQGNPVLDIFQVNDYMSSKGWELNALQRPPAVHICITMLHLDFIDAFYQDLFDAAHICRFEKSNIPVGSAPIYGMSSRIANRGAVKDLLLEYMDAVCSEI